MTNESERLERLEKESREIKSRLARLVLNSSEKIGA